MASLPTMTEKQRFLLSVGIIALAAAGLGTVWGFGFRQERALDAESAVLGDQLKQAQAKLARREELERSHLENLEVREILAAQLPDEEDRNGIFGILQQAKQQAGENGASAEFIIHDGKAVDDKVKALKRGPTAPCEEKLLDLTVAGNWAGFVSFLDGIEHSDRLIGVKSFKTDAPSKEDPLTYQYHVTLAYYWMKGAP